MNKLKSKFDIQNKEITTFDYLINKDNELYRIYGDKSGKIVLYNEINEIIFNFDKIKKQINQIQFYNSKDILGFCYCSENAKAGFITKDNVTNKFIEKYNIKNSQAITDFSYHPLQEYILFGSIDKSWSFHNMLKVYYF